MLSKDNWPIKVRLKKIQQIISWIIPPILLLLIIKRIDTETFIQNLASTNVWLLFIAVGYCPAVVLIASIRWKVALAEYLHIRPSFGYLVRHYWIGMALGFFSPGQIGLDAYRIVIIGRRYRHFTQMLFSVLIEKAMALLNAVLLVICLYPFIKCLVVHHSSTLDQIINTSYFVMLFFLIIAGIFFVLFQSNLAPRLIKSSLIQQAVIRIKNVVKRGIAVSSPEDFSEIKAKLSKPRPLVLLFMTSLSIQFVSAAGNHIIFQAIGYDIPFSLNLFITPIFYFIYLLPMSFGGLGVREGAYVLLYGVFGVPPEVALLVSCINLSGLLMNNAIGVFILWFQRHNGKASCLEPERVLDVK
jgi:glycosyltransferase 2 family protein